jgi:hypothetical protein
MYLQLVSINNSNTQKKPDAGKSTSGLFLLHQPLFGWLLPIDCGMMLGCIGYKHQRAHQPQKTYLL